MNDFDWTLLEPMGVCFIIAGEQEVLGEVPVIHIQPDFANEDRDERVILDSMIERLQREQDERLAAARGEPFRSPPPPGGSPRAARSNSSQYISYGNWVLSEKLA